MLTNNLLLLCIFTEPVTMNLLLEHSASLATCASIPALPPLLQCGTFQMLSFPSRLPQLVFPLMFVLSGCQHGELGCGTSGPLCS